MHTLETLFDQNLYTSHNDHPRPTFPPPYLQTPPRLFPLATTSNRFKTLLPLGSPPPALWRSSLCGLQLARILSKRFATKSCLLASQHFPRPLPSNFYDASPPRGVREKKTPTSFSRPLPPFFTLPPPSPPPQQLLGPAAVVTGEFSFFKEPQIERRALVERDSALQETLKALRT